MKSATRIATGIGVQSSARQWSGSWTVGIRRKDLRGFVARSAGTSCTWRFRAGAAVPVRAATRKGLWKSPGGWLNRSAPRWSTGSSYSRYPNDCGFGLLVAEGKISEEVVANIRSWKHSGFSVDQSVRLEAGDREGIERLVQYFLRCPFSQARMVEVTGEGKVLYKTGENRLGRYPEAASEDLSSGTRRNFQIFEPLDFLAEVTQHIPELGEHQIRSYGWYSNKKRGQRGKGQTPLAAGEGEQFQAPGGKQARKRWAALIKQVYEVDPLSCPKCGEEMRIIAFIERRQGEVVEKILRHSGLWDEAPERAPPAQPESVKS